MNFDHGRHKRPMKGTLAVTWKRNIRQGVHLSVFNEDLKKIVDLNRSEYFILSCLAAPILFYGFYPDPLINTIEVSVTDLINMHATNLASK